MSAIKNDSDAQGWVQTKSKGKSWSIDRKKNFTQKTGVKGHMQSHPGVKKIVKEKIPDIVSDMLVTEFLTLVGNSDWNDPENISKTIANMMSIDLFLSLLIREAIFHIGFANLLFV